MPQTSFPPSAASQQPEQPVRSFSIESNWVSNGTSTESFVRLFDHAYDLSKPSDRQALKNIAKGILEAL